MYVLMMMSVTMGWVIMPMDGNPFPTEAKCKVVERVVMNSKVRIWEGVRFHRVKCKLVKGVTWAQR